MNTMRKPPSPDEFFFGLLLNDEKVLEAKRPTLILSYLDPRINQISAALRTKSDNYFLEIYKRYGHILCAYAMELSNLVAFHNMKASNKPSSSRNLKKMMF